VQQNPFTISEVRQHWDSVATEYDRINHGFDWTHTERFATMRALLSEFSDGFRDKPWRILNVWSRTGDAIPHLRQVAPAADIENLEASPEMLEIARTKYPGESFAVTHLHDLPPETESREVVVSLETLEHVPDPLHFLLECHRILIVGGILILSCPPSWAELPLRLYERFFENHGEGPHRFRAVGEVLRTLRHCGFEILEHRGTVLLPVGPVWARRGVEAVHQRLLRHLGFNRLGIRHFFVAEKGEARDPVWAKIHEEIIRPGLSMQSGTCVGLSRGTLELHEPDGACLPRPSGMGPVPKICYEASPEVDPDYPLMTATVFGSLRRSSLLGCYRRIAIAYSTDEMIRRNAASGGILTAVLLHLLATGAIRGAVVLTMDRERPWRAVPTIARTREAILASAQSKYVVSPVNTILGKLEEEEGPLAYVGLPHQVFAVRRLQQLRHPSVRPVKFVLGPFFGNELSGGSVDAFLSKFGATKEDLEAFHYRAGEWPGSLRAALKGGRVVELPKFHANYLIPFHITDNSLLSHDLTNELTDLSGGDAWAPTYEERGKGFSLLIVRSEVADQVIREMESAGDLVLHDITEEEAVQMQSHGLDLKKRGALLRMERRRRQGNRIHEYRLPTPGVSVGRRAFESLLGLLFTFCRSPAGRACAHVVPHRIIGPLFQWFRKMWKTMTKNVKREGLSPEAREDSKGARSE
jgi:coenzyme F420 hydrogenase subunit beta